MALSGERELQIPCVTRAPLHKPAPRTPPKVKMLVKHHLISALAARSCIRKGQNNPAAKREVVTRDFQIRDAVRCELTPRRVPGLGAGSHRLSDVGGGVSRSDMGLGYLAFPACLFPFPSPFSPDPHPRTLQTFPFLPSRRSLLLAHSSSCPARHSTRFLSTSLDSILSFCQTQSRDWSSLAH